MVWKKSSKINGQTHADDYYNQGSLISFYTNPSNARYCGLNGGFEINNFSEPSDTMTCTLTMPEEKPLIYTIEKLKKPFRLKLNGENIQNGASVVIGNASTVWPYTTHQQDSLILEKGRKLKKKFVKGVPTKFILINPDGSATKESYTR